MVRGVGGRLKTLGRNGAAAPRRRRQEPKHDEQGGVAMGGRFGKYGDVKRKAVLRKSRTEKRRLQEQATVKPRKRRRGGKGGAPP